MTDKPDVHAVFHALGDPTRQRLMEKLAGGPATVSQLAKPLGITLAAVVQHLQILEESGLVVSQKVGRVRTCRIHGVGLAIATRWIAARSTLRMRPLGRMARLPKAEEAGAPAQTSPSRGDAISPPRPERAIIGFHQDEYGEWVADLACGHSQHVRHRPPFELRPWVTTAAGREEFLGHGLPCAACTATEDAKGEEQA
jgi:DNA-binding transcriptional ArsR family regulator